MIVLKSFKAKDINPLNSEDLLIFRKWLEFLELTKNKQKKYALNLESTSLKNKELLDNELFNDIYKEILFIINNSNENLKIEKNYNIGSQNIDIAFINKKNNKYIYGIIIDNYEYCKRLNYNKFLNKKSDENFFKFKGYNLLVIEEINWKISKNNIK